MRNPAARFQARDRSDVRLGRLTALDISYNGTTTFSDLNFFYKSTVMDSDDEAYSSNAPSDTCDDAFYDARWDTKHLPVLCFPIDAGGGIQLRQYANSLCHGLTVWDASKVLIKYLERLYTKSPRNRLFVKGGGKCRWLELGAGCGLLGIGVRAIFLFHSNY